MSEIPLFQIHWDKNDVANAVESISRGSYWAKGPFVEEFESGLEEYFNIEHALVVNSGTTALECALRAHGVGPGDEVLVPAFTFIATANVVELVGATPVFVDVERETFGMDPDDAREKVTSETTAIMPVHLYGSPCRIEELTELAADEDLALIEDAAEAFGARAGGQPVGTFGDTTGLSFCQNKVLPTGEGGAVLTNDAELAEMVRNFRSHGRVSGDYFDSTDSGEYVDVGSNYRMPDMVAAIGCSQLEKVEELIDGRRRVARAYDDELGDLEGVTVVSGRNGRDDRNVYQLYTVVLDEPEDRQTVVRTLGERNIACKVYWDQPVHRAGYYADREHGELPVADNLSSRVLSLPMYPGLTKREIERVANAVVHGLTG